MALALCDTCHTRLPYAHICDGHARHFLPPRAALAPGNTSHSPDVLCAATHNLQLCVMPRRTPRLSTALAFRDL
eukprot:5527057-Pleurochrysis_carterae.AAC.1